MLTRLRSDHYAYKWPLPTGDEKDINDLHMVNDLGIAYATSSNMADKEEKLLALIKYFHGYVFKYLDTIARGHLPRANWHRLNSDSKAFLRYFLRKGELPNKVNFLKVARTLHLAFKGMDATELYDTLIMLLLRSMERYDPYYAEKCKNTVETIEKSFRRAKRVNAAEINKLLSFDCTSSLRKLAKAGYLEAVKNDYDKLVGYKRSAQWPPKKEYLNSGPIGFTYFIQTWFRYYLQEYIDDQMKMLETKEDVMQMGYEDGDNNPITELVPIREPFSAYNRHQWLGELPDTEGIIFDQMVYTDTSMITKSLDISKMNLAWVESTTDHLFKDFTRSQRLLLYMKYVEELGGIEIAKALDMSLSMVQTEVQDMIEDIREKIKS